MRGTYFAISSIRRVSISDAVRIPTVFEKARQAGGFICLGTSIGRAEDPLRAGRGTTPVRLDGIGWFSEKQMNVSSEATDEAAVSPVAVGSSREIVSAKSKGIPPCSNIKTVLYTVGPKATSTPRTRMIKAHLGSPSRAGIVAKSSYRFSDAHSK